MTKTLLEEWLPGRFTLLLFLLPASMLLAPLLGNSIVGRLAFNAIVTLLLLVAVQAAALKAKARVVAWTLLLVSLLFRWSGHALHHVGLQGASDFLAALFLSLITIELFLYVVRARRVDIDLISAGLCVYLLLAVTFALLYSTLDRVAPDSFAMPADRVDAVTQASVGRVPDYVYYSFVTMTTTGFGDIRPVSQIARGLTVIEILLGQLYLVVMISRLVSTWGSGSDSSTS